MLSIATASYAIGSFVFSLLALVLLTGHQTQVRKRLLMLASAATSLWMGVSAYQSAQQDINYASYLLELVRDFGWLAFLAGILASAYSDEQQQKQVFRKFLKTAGALLVFIASLTLYRYFSQGQVVTSGAIDWLLACYLSIAILGLVFVEQVLRNTRADNRRAIKYFCLGIGGIFVYDFYLYADALLFQRVDPALWYARGIVNVMAVPLFVLAIKRDPKWSADIFISRRVVFHSAALLGTGVYLLAMGVGGYYVRVYGGEWGAVFQAIFFFGAIMLLAILFFSDQARAKLRVLINKHFFHYKYDYRDEWLRFIGTLSLEGPEHKLCPRIVRAIAKIIDSPGGVLWWLRESGNYEAVGAWNTDLPKGVSIAASDSMVHFLKEQEWIINLEEYQQTPAIYGDLVIPPWMVQRDSAWLVMPLLLRDHLLGFIMLDKAPDTEHFNWEDCDLLKTVGREAASHLAQMEASTQLAESRQFETYNRLSTYVVHDLKNLIGQLSLVVSNAAKHKHNPDFMEDAIRTVDHSVEKMNRLLAHLRSGAAADEKKECVDLCGLLHDVVHTMSSGLPLPSVDCQATGICASANKERFAAVIGHVIRNAQDATPDDGRIIVRLFRLEDDAIIEVQDTGCGMDEEFIRTRLFKPFETTKGSAGMGVGVHETQSFVRNLGGDVQVISRVGEGTTFRLRVPISDTSKAKVKLSIVEGMRAEG